ncbi:DNA replication regulator SLD3-domain-containing protein [Astrocystis sublimbata]|nr:DNA replication regulator SLD3-domain-containing protein [Astrocystis sublimbata]
MSMRAQDPDASRPLRPASQHHRHVRDVRDVSTGATAAAADPGGSSAMEELLRPLIVIKPHPHKVTVKPRTVQPLMLLPREHLRLSFLDLASPHGNFEPSPAFEANIRILDLESRMGNRPVVLIARLESNRTAYAIERQTNGLYTLCHLGSWVDLEQLCHLATVSCPALLRDQPAPQSGPVTHVPSTTPQLSHANKKRRLAIEAIQSLVKKPARSQSISALSQAADSSRPPTPILAGSSFVSAHESVSQDVTTLDTSISEPAMESQAGLVRDEHDPLAIPSAQDIFENVRSQYFEALYHSKGSLAYFAKGPLSRARAAFHLDCDATLEMGDLVEFLQSLVLTAVQIDKKYRETIPKIQVDMKTAIEESEDEQGQGKSKPRKRKTKKMKLGKDGLYTGEFEHVRKWWAIHKPELNHDVESATKSTEQQDIRLQTSLLRSRETQLQMIIILEVMALEPLIRENTSETQLPGLPLEEAHASPKPMPTKKRTKHNFPVLLDVHADRLCIWQSIAFDEYNMSHDSQAGSKLESQGASKWTADSLKEFCVDIIVPFFSARLPEQCDSINKKLGGPVMMAPPKSARKKAEANPSKTKAKPGASAKRPARPSMPKTLETFMSKETERNRRSMSRGPSGLIALMRSASTPVPLLKREASEPLSLVSIPRADASSSRENLLSSSGPESAKRRAETKERRGAFVKAELQDAISTLRRPNREVAARAMAEADTRRAVTSLSQLRKSKKPTQHNRFQTVVKATPVGTRFHDALAKSNEPRPASLKRFNTISEGQAIPSSSMVPSSAPKKRSRETAFGSEPTTSSHSHSHSPQRQDRQPQVPASASRRDHVMATPAKPSSHSQHHHFLTATPLPRGPQHDEGVVLASSPVMARKIAQPSFVSRAGAGRPVALGHRDSGIEMAMVPPSSPGGLSVLGETPMKMRQNGNGNGNSSTILAETPVKKMRGQNTNTNTNASTRNGGVASMDTFVTVTPVKKSVDVDVDRGRSPPGVENDHGKGGGGGDGDMNMNKPRKMTIFEHLGWDDYDDLA